MINLILICTSICLSLFPRQNFAQLPDKAVTYLFSGGRFGDNLICYLHAKWLSYKYNIPLLYKPFSYSDQLQLHIMETWLFQQNEWVNLRLKDEKEILSLEKDCFAEVPYFPECEIEYRMFPAAFPHRFLVDWKNPEFKALIRKLVSPRRQLRTIHGPRYSCHAVAVHIRTGGNFDSPIEKAILSHKFPPLSFYIEAIRKMSELLSHEYMYVYVFTDDINPLQLLNILQNGLVDLTNIELNGPKYKRCMSSDILIDFFSLQNFDYLIRSQSNFSIVAEKLHDFKIVISPTFYIMRDRVYVDSMHIDRSI
ncbi:MAG TPA: hypothetical protein VGJ00_02565 [Rhabdochlamydiaceae bacterium]|jgi:hypothetical protein